MYYYIRGRLVYLDLSTAVIDAGGVGYQLSISQNTYEKLPHDKDNREEVILYTHLSVREDAMELFGFFTEEELSSFRQLINVSGVGPKGALAVLSLFTPQKLVLAVLNGDQKAIAKATNIGPKTAARIILELKDKFKGIDVAQEDSAADLFTPSATNDSKASDAKDALLVLGYTRSEIDAALRKIDTAHLDVDAIIKTALRMLMK